MENKEDFQSEMPLSKIYEMDEARIELLNKNGIDEDKIISDTNDELGSWDAYFSENIRTGKEDVVFALRDQWTPQERSEFKRTGKVCLTINKLWDPIKKQVGEQRKNKPDLMVRAQNSRASQEEINLRADLLRTYCYKSQNDIVYQVAYLSCLIMGLGAFQVDLDYKHPLSFDMIPVYKLINDPTLCAWDPSAMLTHKSDGNYCSRRFVLSKKEFFATYPYIMDPSSFGGNGSALDYQWVSRDTITVCERFVKEWFPVVIYKLSNGETVTEDEWEKREKNFEGMREYLKDSISGEIINKEIPIIIDKRLSQNYKIMRYRLIRDKILEFSEWPSRHLPLIFVDGCSYYHEGKQYTKSIIRESRDAQRAFNYSRSEAITELKNRRREQWLATPDNIKGNEDQWRNPELQLGALVANPHPASGLMPIKQPAWQISEGIFNISANANQDIRETMGVSEADDMLGRDISGKARRERKSESGMSFYVYHDNLKQSLEQGGRVVNDLITYLHSSGQEMNVSLTKRDGKSESIIINQKLDGKLLNKITDGEFDVEIDAGPSFAVQQETALEFLQQTLSVFPQAFPLVADLWAKNLDVQFREQMAERFKTMVPPEILAKEEGKPPPPKELDPQQMMMMQEMKNKEMALQERQENLELNKEKHEIEKAQLILKIKELENKMAIEQQKSQTEIYKTTVSHDVDLKKLMADLHKHHNPINK